MNARTVTIVLFLALVLVVPVQPIRAEEDLKPLATASCEVPGLAVVPPAPWYSVPIDSAEAIVEGCQMLWEEGDQYMGIMRLVSFDLREQPEAAGNWENFAIGFEAMVMEEMNFKLGQELWRRDTVPVTGEGFGNGKAIGFQARLEGVEHANEAHFMLFQSTTHTYIISMLTPSQAASPEVYEANTRAMGQVMQTLQPR